MTAVLGSAAPPIEARAAKALRASAVFWFVTAVAGQWMFAAYVALFYGGAAIRGDLTAWNEVLPKGLVAGDGVGNAALAAHLLLAFVITVGGTLQLIPQVRARAPAFHRWNGRIYMATAFAISLAGLWLVWTRQGFLAGQLALTLNAALIMAFAVLALRAAVRREISTHQRWALRLFLVVSGVWFLRVAVMVWVIANRGPAGLGENLEGPVGVALSFGQYLVPLAVLELYLRARDHGGPVARLAMAGGLFLLTMVMAAGIAGASAFMWLPKM